jgi:phage terminase large subunit
MNRLGCKWTAVEKFPGSRLAGLSTIHQRLAKRDDGTVGLKVSRGRCPNLVRTLPALTYSTRNPDEIDPSCGDHAVDCLRYALLFRPLESRMVRLGGI